MIHNRYTRIHAHIYLQSLRTRERVETLHSRGSRAAYTGGYLCLHRIPAAVVINTESSHCIRARKPPSRGSDYFTTYSDVHLARDRAYWARNELSHLLADVEVMYIFYVTIR